MIRAGSTRQILLVAVPLLLGALWASELPVHALAPTGAEQSKAAIHCFDGSVAVGNTPKGDGEPVLQRDPSDPGRLLAAWTTKESPGSTPAESPITGWIVLAQRDSQGNWTKKTVGEGLDPWLYFSQSGVAYLSYFKFEGISTTLHVHKVFSNGALGPNIAPVLGLSVDHPSITVAPNATPAGDHLYLVATTSPPLSAQLKGALIESKDGGTSWETQVGFPPSRPSVIQAAPVVASGGDQVLAAWLEYPIFGPTTSTGKLRVAAYDSSAGKFVAVSDIATIEGGVKFPGSTTAKSALVYAATVRADGSIGSNHGITKCPSYPEAGGPSSDSLYGDYFIFDASQRDVELIFPQIREPGGDSDVYYHPVK